MLQTRALPSCFWWDRFIPDPLIPILACDPQETFLDSLLEVGLIKQAVTGSVSALCLCQVNFPATITHFSSAGYPDRVCSPIAP